MLASPSLLRMFLADGVVCLSSRSVVTCSGAAASRGLTQCRCSGCSWAQGWEGSGTSRSQPFLPRTLHSDWMENRNPQRRRPRQGTEAAQQGSATEIIARCTAESNCQPRAQAQGPQHKKHEEQQGGGSCREAEAAWAEAGQDGQIGRQRAPRMRWGHICRVRATLTRLSATSQCDRNPSDELGRAFQPTQKPHCPGLGRLGQREA